MIRASAVRAPVPGDPAPWDRVVLTADDRYVRRGLVVTSHGPKILIDLAEAQNLRAGDRLLLDDGRHVEVRAMDEPLYAIRPRDSFHLARLAWHLGNRHVPAQLEPGRLLIARDPVLRSMLEAQGAAVAEVVEPFDPEGGAYDPDSSAVAAMLPAAPHRDGAAGHDHAHAHGGHRHRHGPDDHVA